MLARTRRHDGDVGVNGQEVIDGARRAPPYGERWAGAASLTQILAIGGMIAALSRSKSTVAAPDAA